MMKSIGILAALLIALPAISQPSDPSPSASQPVNTQLSVVEGESTTIAVPFEVQSYAASNKEVIGVEFSAPSTLRVSGLKRGRCSLAVTGEGGMQIGYEITVAGNLACVLDAILLDLDTLPEVRAEIRGESIRLDGEITSIAKWEYYRKVMASYAKQAKDFVKFSPGPELMTQLRALFGEAGFQVVTNRFEGVPSKWPYDKVSAVLNPGVRTITLRAAFVAKSRLAQARRLAASMPYLMASGKPHDEHSFTLIDEMCAAEPAIRLSVCYLAISEGEVSSLGSENTLEISGVFHYLADIARKRYTDKHTASFDAGLEPIARFSAANNIGRVSDRGYVVFDNWDEKGGEFKSGGSRYVKVASGLAADLKEIQYGFDVKVHGGLVSSDKAKLTMDISISKPEVDESGDVDKKEEFSKQTLTCPLGKTLAIGGFGEIIDEATLDGVPYVRNWPFLSWFVAKDNDSMQRRRLVILISPEIVELGEDGVIDVDREVTLPARTESERTAEELEGDRKPFHGIWSWLNIFTF